MSLHSTFEFSEKFKPKRLAEWKAPMAYTITSGIISILRSIGIKRLACLAGARKEKGRGRIGLPALSKHFACASNRLFAVTRVIRYRATGHSDLRVILKIRLNFVYILTKAL